MKKNVTRLLALAALAPLALTACGGGGQSTAAEDVKELTVLDYYNNEPDKSHVQKALDRCAGQLGVTLKRETTPGKDLIQKVLQRSSSRTLPDVLMLDNPDVKEIAATGGLSPLGDYGVDTSGFAPGMIDAATLDGKVYGLAPTANTLGLFYNKEMLAAAGVEPPRTWDELKAAAAKLTTGDRYGLAFSAIATYEGAWQFLPFMWTNGGDETDLTGGQVAEALAFTDGLVASGSASKSVVNWSQADVRDQFAAGKAAMMINGPWQIPSLAKTPDVKWEAVQVPVNEAGQTPVAPLGGEVWTVPQTGSKAKQAKAAELVECIASDENQLALAKERFVVPTRTALGAEYAKAVPEMAAFTEQVANARSRTGKLGKDWPKAATVMYTAIQLSLTDQATPEEAFARASAG
ncbi:sugar ABC transporter substrate-binding protein [Sinomonas mesophila]|uniref:sugar ABC transporter substrate-binding protein n=1 Tax=Sinomonas mesophila TaxID=1531955 RepID=UPI000986FE3C|nr:extracellular solute-binding protein [Sinomonas mesophila]